MSLKSLKGGLIVSCQALETEPLHSSFIMSKMALAAKMGGAVGIRANTIEDICEIRKQVSLPVIGIIKKDYPESSVYITPTYVEAEALCKEGVEILALDATLRPRPKGETLSGLVARIRQNFPGVKLMADTATFEEACHAETLGFDFIGTTLYGYTEETKGLAVDENDFAHLRRLIQALKTPIIGEGKLSTPEKARRALELGCYCVVVGGAITRPLEITRAYMAEISRVASLKEPQATLAVDLGGTKVLVALVRNGKIEVRFEQPTARESHPDQWIETIQSLSAPLAGQFGAVGIAVTGVVHKGLWHSFNPKTLSIPKDYPLVEKLRAAFGLPVLAVNDAQAAAWGEFVYGAGQRKDMVFLTVSTGLGGGVVLNGRLLEGRFGLAGSFGQTLYDRSQSALRLEDEVTGLWIAERAREQGHDVSAKDVLLAAEDGALWAEAITCDSAARVARLCQNIQVTLDPERIVIGGGIGLNPFFLKKVQSFHAGLPAWLYPDTYPALLGKDAGAVGVADLASHLQAGPL